MKKRILVLAVVFFMVACSVNLIAGEPRGDGPQKKRFEVAAMAGLTISEGSTLSRYLYKLTTLC